jgi:peptide chain release factor 1
MLSMNTSTSARSTSRKYSATVRPGEPDAEARPRRLVHLAVDERHLVEDPGLLELQVQVVPLARALAHAAEHALPAVPLGDVVDQLLDDDRLAHAGAAEEPDLPALHERGDQVDDLDPRLEHLGLRLERDELRAAAVDRPPERVGRDVGAVVHRHAEHVEDAAERRGADRHRDRRAGVRHVHAADHRVGGRHRHRAHGVAPDVLLHLGRHVDARAVRRHRVDAQRVVDLGQVLGLELHVEDRADDLHDLADVVRGDRGCHELSRYG